MTDFCVEELQSVIAREGPENIAGMFGELVIGPGGMIPLPDDYWPRMTAVLRQHGILFVADEVVTAFGRAGAWFTSNDYGLAPDIIVLAKGIASGAQFLDELSPLEQHPLVGTIRGRGLMIGVELVTDKDSRQSIASVAPALHQELPRYVRRVHGILLGMRAGAIVLTPPLIITESEVSRICKAVIDAVNRIDPKNFTLPNSLQ